MTREQTNAAMEGLPQAADDFTCINGIGLVTTQRLHHAGIRTFAQLAALSAEGIASLIPHLSAKQVIKQNWVQQARERASGKASGKTREGEFLPPVRRQHYENFAVEFLLGEKNKIRRLQIVHIQSGDVDTATKWDAERLIDFLARHTGVRLSYAQVVVLATEKPKSALKPSMATEQVSEVATETGSIRPAVKPEETPGSTPSHEITESTSRILAPSDHPHVANAPQPVSASAVPASAGNRIRLLEWKTFLSGTRQILHNLHHDQCFDVNLTLDLANASLPTTSQLDFTVSLYAKRLGDGARHLIANLHSTRPYSSIIDLTVGNATLPQGLYRLEVLVILVPADKSLPAGSDINTSIKGGLFQVY